MYVRMHVTLVACMCVHVVDMFCMRFFCTLLFLVWHLLSFLVLMQQATRVESLETHNQNRPQSHGGQILHFHIPNGKVSHKAVFRSWLLCIFVQVIMCRYPGLLVWRLHAWCLSVPLNWCRVFWSVFMYLLLRCNETIVMHVFMYMIYFYREPHAPSNEMDRFFNPMLRYWLLEVAMPATGLSTRYGTAYLLYIFTKNIASCYHWHVCMSAVYHKQHSSERWGWWREWRW